MTTTKWHQNHQNISRHLAQSEFLYKFVFENSPKLKNWYFFFTYIYFHVRTHVDLVEFLQIIIYNESL